MSNYLKKNLLTFFKLCNIGIFIGFLLGLLFGILHIIENRYLDYKLYNLVLFNLREFVTDYTIIFVLLALGIILVEKFVVKIIGSTKINIIKDEKTILALSYSLYLICILTVVFYVFYPDLLVFLKITFKNRLIKNLPRMREELITISWVIFTIFALIFIPLSTYLISKFGPVTTIHSWLKRISGSRITTSLGLGIITIVAILNLFVFSYRYINRPQGPNIILITIDTLRADHLGIYGHSRGTSPNIDNLVQKGILFENAYSQAPWTYPSMSSMHTSLYPSQIGADDISYKLNDSFLTLAEFMQNGFYKTIAVISNIVVTDIMGFSQGFDIYDQSSLREKNEYTSHLVTDQAIKYLSNTNGNKLFLWLHYMDPHSNYIRHTEYGYSSNYSGELGDNPAAANLNKLIESSDISEQDIQYVRDLYDEEISFMDKNIGRLLEALSALGLSSDTIIILTADHGEELLDRTRYGHMRTLYQELVHVPLIIYVPSMHNTEPRKVKSSVEIRNIARTILDLSGLKNNYIQGDNLLVIAEDDNSSSYAYNQIAHRGTKNARSEGIISNSWKLINNISEQTYELYDLENDPLEKNNLFNKEDERLNNLKKDLITKMSLIDKERLVEIVEVEFKKEDIKKLKALGYIQ